MPVKDIMNRTLSLLSLILIFGCRANPYKASNKVYRQEVKSYTKQFREPAPDYFPGQPKDRAAAVNFDLRKPDFIIIHHTAQNSCPATLHTFTIPESKVSAHYVICKDGTVHHMLNDYLRAWQAGAAKWGHNTDINSCSIGIELDNNGYEPFPAIQIRNLITLLDTLKLRYKIPAENVIGHGDIAPGRKVDPNWRFPWKDLADSGFGMWYGDTTGILVPESFNEYTALRFIGYNLKDTLSAINAFRRHWLQDTLYQPFDSATDKVLYTLSLKYQ